VIAWHTNVGIFRPSRTGELGQNGNFKACGVKVASLCSAVLSQLPDALSRRVHPTVHLSHSGRHWHKTASFSFGSRHDAVARSEKVQLDLIAYFAQPSKFDWSHAAHNWRHQQLDQALHQAGDAALRGAAQHA